MKHKNWTKRLKLWYIAFKVKKKIPLLLQKKLWSYNSYHIDWGWCIFLTDTVRSFDLYFANKQVIFLTSFKTNLQSLSMAFKKAEKSFVGFFQKRLCQLMLQTLVTLMMHLKKSRLLTSLMARPVMDCYENALNLTRVPTEVRSAERSQYLHDKATNTAKQLLFDDREILLCA